MKNLLLFAALVLGLFSTAASAAPAPVQALVVSSCGGLSLAANTYGIITMDTTGTLCSAAGSGGGGLSITDNTAFTYGTSKFTPGGGVYNTSITPLTSGNQGAFALTANRSLHTLDDNSAAVLAAVQAAIPAGTNVIGYTTNDPCTSALPHTYTPINTTASAQILAGTASKQTYVCHLLLVNNAADNVALVEGTGSVCAGSTAGMAGGATAATGFNFGANGGLNTGTGERTVFKTATLADNVCLLVSASTQLSGILDTVQQ